MTVSVVFPSRGVPVRCSGIVGLVKPVVESDCSSEGRYTYTIVLVKLWSQLKKWSDERHLGEVARCRGVYERHGAGVVQPISSSTHTQLVSRP